MRGRRSGGREEERETGSRCSRWMKKRKSKIERKMKEKKKCKKKKSKRKKLRGRGRNVKRGEIEERDEGIIKPREYY